MKMTATK